MARVLGTIKDIHINMVRGKDSDISRAHGRRKVNELRAAPTCPAGSRRRATGKRREWSGSLNEMEFQFQLHDPALSRCRRDMNHHDLGFA